MKRTERFIVSMTRLLVVYSCCYGLSLLLEQMRTWFFPVSMRWWVVDYMSIGFLLFFLILQTVYQMYATPARVKNDE